MGFNLHHPTIAHAIIARTSSLNSSVRGVSHFSATAGGEEGKVSWAGGGDTALEQSHTKTSV